MLAPEGWTFKNMDQDYVVLDPHDKRCGALTMAICADFAALDKIMPFSKLEGYASFSKLPDPASFGFKFFEKQLPTGEIYPIAALLDLEIDYDKRRRGFGSLALRAFRAVAADRNARLGLLRIGTSGGDEEYETAVLWRKRFYSTDGWTAFDTPPLPGLTLVWMYHLLPPLSVEELMVRNRLIEAKTDRDEFGPLE